MKAFNKKLILIFFISLLFLLAACTDKTTTESNKENKEKQSSEKSIVIGLTNAPSVFNPFEFNNATDRQMTALLFSPLVELNNEYGWTPMLADSITTENYQTYTIKLNPNAKWSDGEPITADDVIFTYKLIGNPNITYSYSNNFAAITGYNSEGKLENPEAEDISGVKKIDNNTVEVELKSPMDPNTFNDYFGKSVKTLPKHILKDIEPASFEKNEFFRKPTVTSGPYTFVTYQKDQYLELAANENYYKGKPKVDSLFFKVLTAANITAQLDNGEIDMNFPALGNIPIEDYEKVQNMSHIKTVTGNPSSTQILTFNLDVIKDKKVRHAIMHAIDRESVVKNLFKGGAEIVDSSYPPGHPYYNEKFTPREYNPEKAKELLKEAGWDNNKTLRFVVPSGNSARERFANIIVENLRSVGVKAEIEMNDISTVIKKFTEKDFDIILFGFTFEFDPDETSYLKTGAHYNASGYSNPQMDSLLEQGLNEVVPEKRKVIYDQVQELLIEDLPMTGTIAERPLGAINKRIIGAAPVEPGMLTNVHEWDIKAE